MKKILILAPHTNDGELGCGGTAAKLIEEGNKVCYCAFSACEETVPEGVPRKILENTRRYMSRDYIESIAKVRGVQMGAEYVEAFEVVRWVF